MTAIALTRRALRGKSPVLVTAIAAVALFAVPAAAQTSPPTADIGVVSLTPSRTTAAHGTRVTFSEVVRNNGPDAVEMDTVPQIKGGTLVNEVCQNVSPDTPFCEYGVVPAGTSLTAKFVVQVTATHGSLTVKGGVVSESAFEDDNPFDQFRSASVKIG
jgi:hypothetical protein